MRVSRSPVLPLTGPALALAVSLVLAACQSLTPDAWKTPEGSAAPVVDHSSLDSAGLPAYAQALLGLSREALAQETAYRRDRSNETHLPLDRAKLALALTLPNQNQRDTTRALVAITDVPRDGKGLTNADLALIAYVEALLAWQARQEEVLQGVLQDRTPGSSPAGGPADSATALQTLVQKLRAELKRNEAQVDQLDRRARDEKARADSLQQKLDALANLEKSLAERKPRTEPAR